jgi:tRNA threonylcarbamoyl adenosine modification protein (Sua5/YciO/YrdC/YwlC family)
MSQYFEIHPDNPQARLIHQAVKIIRDGGVIAYPTDSSYALGCHIGDKGSMERIRRIRKVEKEHNFTLVCRDLSEIATYARVHDTDYRFMKSLTPGPYTFILRATREVPKRLQNPKRKTIGIRVPDSQIVRDLLTELDEPIMSSSMILPGKTTPMSDPWEIREQLEHELDLVIDGGFCGIEPTTVVDLTEQPPRLARRGMQDDHHLDELLA